VGGVFLKACSLENEALLPTSEENAPQIAPLPTPEPKVKKTGKSKFQSNMNPFLIAHANNEGGTGRKGEEGEVDSTGPQPGLPGRKEKGSLGLMKKSYIRQRGPYSGLK